MNEANADVMKEMDRIHELLDRLDSGTPFALARFNDGEMAGIRGAGCTVARGDQYVDENMSEMLRYALVFEAEEYWKGLPCSTCWPEMRRLADEIVTSGYAISGEPSSTQYAYITKAVVTTNRNWPLFIEGFCGSVNRNDSRVVWVSGDDQKFDELGFRVAAHHKVPTRNAWSSYEKLLSAVDNFETGDIVVLSCGPMSRILAQQYWAARRDCTFLDVGSAFDPFTRGVRHNCHIWNDGRNQAKRCEECN